MGSTATVATGKQGESQVFLTMHLLVLLLAAVVSAQKAAPPPPPDRNWFRQDTLPAGETCSSMYEKVKGTAALITGKDPIILPEEANFKICIKFFEGSYVNPKTGEAVKRAGRDWAHDGGKKSSCAEGCCEFQFGSLAKKYVPWFPTSSDCSNTASAKEAPLYFKSSAGKPAKLCAKLPEKPDGPPVWQLFDGSAAGCQGPCCTIKSQLSMMARLPRHLMMDAFNILI